MVLAQAAKSSVTFLERRYVLNALVPTFIFQLTMITVVGATELKLAGVTMGDVRSAWRDLQYSGQLFLALCFIATWLLVSSFVANQWRNIVRLFEGYPLLRLYRICEQSRNELEGAAESHPSPQPPIDVSFVDVSFRANQESEQRPERTTDQRTARSGPPMKHRNVSRIDGPGVRYHRANFTRLFEAGDIETIYYRYPQVPNPATSDEIMPSAIGNCIRASERYSNERYKADAIYMWPRLYPLIPREFGADFERYVINYQFLLVVSFLSALSGVLGSAYVLLRDVGDGAPSRLLFIILSLGAPMIAWLSYRLALPSAISYGEQMRVAFDLYRHLLLKQVEWTGNPELTTERQRFTALQRFYVMNQPLSSEGEVNAHRAHEDAEDQSPTAV